MQYESIILHKSIKTQLMFIKYYKGVKGTNI